MVDNRSAENRSQFPVVSVIIPVYNGMRNLPDCLDSLERQDYQGEFEVIVVDDGSTDGSGDYAEKRGVKVIRQQNQGPGIARNTGAKSAKGEYLVFTDDDCVLDEDFLTQIVTPLIGTDIIGAQGILYTNQKSLVARFIQYEHSERHILQAKSKYLEWVSTYAAIYRKDVFLENGGFSDIYSSEDCELSMRLSGKSYKMIFLPSARVRHRHFESFYKFLHYKFKRAYWTIWLYKRFPGRTVKDRETPASRKMMMVYLLITLSALILSPFWILARWVGIISLIVLLASTAPLTSRTFQKDWVVGILTPLFLIARTTSYIMGFILGLFDYFLGQPRIKRSQRK